MAYLVSELLDDRSGQFRLLKLWLSWLRVPGVGWRTFSKLLVFCEQRQVDLGEVWDSGYLQIEAGLSYKLINLLNLFKKDFDIDKYLRENVPKNTWFLSLKSKHYPYLLKQIADPPWLLFGQGPVPDWNQLAIAMVGTRHPTPYGQQVIEKLIAELAPYQPLIVSGAMYGIDSLAHQTALKNQVATVGVLGYGLSRVSPESANRLMVRALDQGMSFISEYHPDIAAHKSHFPRRNRIIAGLSQLVVVIEAALNSGSHITARLAGEYGRSLAAVPGSIFSPYSDGTKWLLRQGAVLAGSAQDMLEDLNWQGPVPSQPSPKPVSTYLSQSSQLLYSLLTHQTLTTDQLVQQTGLSPQELGVSLSVLEIAGIIEQQGTGWIVKK